MFLMLALSQFSKMLPTPKSMQLPSLGVDISDTSMKYIGLEPVVADGMNYKLSSWGEIDIPLGVLERGQVLDQKLLVQALGELKEKTKAEFVRVSLPEERAYLFETEIKKSTTEKEIRSILEFRLEENVPIPAREAFFDYDVLESDTTDRAYRVVVAVYARETIVHYYEACLQAGLIPTAFEVEAQAMARSVIPKGLPGAAMLIDFGKTRTGIGIVYNGALMYTSTIDFGGLTLSDLLRRVYGDLSEAEITQIKNTQGLVRVGNDGKSYEALLAGVSMLRDELLSRVQYWHGKDYRQIDRRLKKIILCGGSANLNGFPEYLTEALGIETTRANVWQNTFSFEVFVPPIDLRHSYGYATAIGLAIEKII
jgi:type IV pilus assembly protein PilM